MSVERECPHCGSPVFVDGGTSFTTDAPADGHDWQRADGTVTTCARCGVMGVPG